MHPRTPPSTTTLNSHACPGVARIGACAYPPARRNEILPIPLIVVNPMTHAPLYTAPQIRAASLWNAAAQGWIGW